MPKCKDETGHRYGRLTVIKPYKKTKQGMTWLCRCDCGQEFVAHGVRLRSGYTKSCGCLREMPFDERARLGFWPAEKERDSSAAT